METIIDIHSHRMPPLAGAVTDISPLLGGNEDIGEFLENYPNLAFSIGIHPWDTLDSPAESLWQRLEQAVSDPSVIAIGECGVDLLKGGPMFRQLQVFKRLVEISERLGKPMIIHDVRAHDIMLGLRRDLAPSQKWLIHGFRGKPQLAESLLKAGFWMSFGERFNEETLRAVPADRILAETDDSEKSISEIITRLSEARGEDLMEAIKGNTAEFLL